MFFRTVALSLALAGVAAAQSNNTQLGLQAIKAHFAQAGLSGENNLLSSFEPSALLDVTFGTITATPGQALSAAQAGPVPQVTVTPANSTVDLSGKFTIMMVDADVVGADESKGQTRHWLLNGATVANGALSNASAAAPGPYAGPGPAQGSGAHRYCILLYAQPDAFANPAGTPEGVTVIQLGEYVQQSGLGPLIAGTYITVEEGTASFSVSATSAVVTSTLPAAASTASGASVSGSRSVSGSGSGSGTGAAPSATGSTPNGAASLKSFGSLAAVVAGGTGFFLL